MDYNDSSNSYCMSVKDVFFCLSHSVPLILGAENMAVVVSTLTFFLIKIYRIFQTITCSGVAVAPAKNA